MPFSSLLCQPCQLLRICSCGDRQQDVSGVPHWEVSGLRRPSFCSRRIPFSEPCLHARIHQAIGHSQAKHWGQSSACHLCNWQRQGAHVACDGQSVEWPSSCGHVCKTVAQMLGTGVSSCSGALARLGRQWPYRVQVVQRLRSQKGSRHHLFGFAKAIPRLEPIGLQLLVRSQQENACYRAQLAQVEAWNQKGVPIPLEAGSLQLVRGLHHKHYGRIGGPRATAQGSQGQLLSRRRQLRQLSSFTWSASKQAVFCQTTVHVKSGFKKVAVEAAGGVVKCFTLHTDLVSLAGQMLPA